MEQSIKSNHVEEMKVQLIAHKAAVESAKNDAEKQRLTDIGNLKSTHQEEIGKTGLLQIQM